MLKAGSFKSGAGWRGVSPRVGLRGVAIRRRAWFAAAVLFGAVSLFLRPVGAKAAGACSASHRLEILAAENFYQDIASQIAGPCARVKSVLSDPNIDPHEYEPSVNDAKEAAVADLVIENGGGYDEWMNKLLSASPSTGRLVINAWDISPVKLRDNEHVWYSAEDMKAVAGAIAADLEKLRPLEAAQFERNLGVFSASLDKITAKMGEIAKRFSGARIALTEPIFMYQAVPMGLKVMTPFAFQKAVAEGIDPPADAMLRAQEQIRKKMVRVLVYNKQTADRFTASLAALARALGVRVVAVSETMPPGEHYQSWMLGQIEAVASALRQTQEAAGGGSAR